MSATKKMSKIDGLTDQQWRAIELLTEGRLTKTEIADEIGVNRNTITAWQQKDELFMAEWRKQAQMKKDHVVATIYSHADQIVDEYLKLIKCTDNRTKGMVLKDLMNHIIGKPNQSIEVNDTRENDLDIDIDSILDTYKAVIPLPKTN